MSSVPAFLNRIPRGLLDFFGIKTMGRYPQQLTEILTASMDLQLWYIENALTCHALSLTSGAFDAPLGQQTVAWTTADPALPVVATSITVPANEVWLVRRYSAKWAMENTITAADYNLGYQRQVGAGFGYFPYTTSRSGFTAGFDVGIGLRTSGEVRTDWSDWVLMQPGSIPSFHQHVLEGTGDVLVTGRIELVRLLS